MNALLRDDFHEVYNALGGSDKCLEVTSFLALYCSHYLPISDRDRPQLFHSTAHVPSGDREP